MARFQSALFPLLAVVVFLAAGGPKSALAAEPAPAAKPNVLFIAVDDLRPELGCYGAAHIKSPNIDALAKNGITFNRAYCQQAVCSPSRISLMTGLRPDSTKIYDLTTALRKTLPDVVTLPQHFKNHGYHAAGFGKIYHGGLDDKESWSVPHTPNRAMQYADPKILAEVKKKGAEGWEQGGRNKGPAWEAAECEDNQLVDGYIADKAIVAMRSLAAPAAEKKPFFLAVGFEKPHLPFVAPKKYFDLYPPAGEIKLPPDMRAPKGAPPIAMTNWAELRPYTGIPKKGPLPEQQAKEMIRAYYASVSYMDAQVGRLLDELDRQKLRDNTIVILWGDHGYQLGEQGLWCKHTNFENSTRVPLIISTPSQKSRGVTDALVELVDVYPTLCALANLSPPKGLEGDSLAPLLDDPQKPIKSAAFSQYPRRENDAVMGYSIRTDRFRYTEWQENWKSGQPNVIARELYDHEADPRETVNLADEAQHAETVKQLSQQLKAGPKKP